MDSSTGVRRARVKEQLYTPHLPMSTVLEGIRNKTLARGTLRVNRWVVKGRCCAAVGFESRLGLLTVKLACVQGLLVRGTRYGVI